MNVKYSVILLKKLYCWNEALKHEAIVIVRQNSIVHQTAREIGCKNSFIQRRILGALQFVIVKLKYYFSGEEKVHLYKYTKDSGKIPRKLLFSCYILAVMN